MEAQKKPAVTIFCLKCGEALFCGAVNGSETCWCDALPNVMPVSEEAASCYCKACLEEILKVKSGI